MGAFPEAKSAGRLLSMAFDPSEKLAVTARIAAEADAVEDFEIRTAGLDEVYASISGRTA